MHQTKSWRINTLLNPCRNDFTWQTIGAYIYVYVTSTSLTRLTLRKLKTNSYFLKNMTGVNEVSPLLSSLTAFEVTAATELTNNILFSSPIWVYRYVINYIFQIFLWLMPSSTNLMTFKTSTALTFYLPELTPKLFCFVKTILEDKIGSRVKIADDTCRCMRHTPRVCSRYLDILIK